MSQDESMPYLQQKINALEQELLELESENHELKRKVKHYEFDRYKYQEVQRLAKAGTWELNHLTYDMTLSPELTRLLWSESKESQSLSWQVFLDLFVVREGVDIKQTFYQDIFKNGQGLDFEHFIKCDDDRIIFVRHHCKTFFNPIGQPLITVGLIHDFTDEHNLEVELQKCSITDELTRLFNRRRINEVLKEQYDIFKRFGTTSSYIMLDIDHFKQINDTYGHQVGDEVLKKMATYISGTIRKIDSAGRWGGEEFLIVCPQTGCVDAKHLAEKIRKGIMTLKISKDIQLTASFGVTEIIADEPIEALVKRVDDALYQAKAKGRNQTVGSGSVCQ